ncbi:sulfatase-like hydrolase/transferase [Halomicroarcula sp. F13]|uniref:Sulfatase-like hydrolase/transferase n=1 Tax=Haloarcula rubra TaxID=2487747 RepID=A0AAW4PPT5_9EURY|nr:sulfatase-like hydrolase/transferase [Halomicroarcula rubra]MBX0323117.1 sulfatase-like hydrolase/transferase [Halomicroarcula rubra]
MTDVNVLLIVLDSVRAQNVSLYDYHRETTPFLEAYSDRATVYTQARAPGIHSVASHASLWTGAHVEQHQVKRHEDELKPETTIWETLNKRDYRTSIFTTNPVVAHSSNLADVFDDRFTDEFVDNKSKLFPVAHSPADVVKHEGIAGNLRRCFQDDSTVKAILNSAHHFYKKERGEATDTVTSSDLVDEFLSWSDDLTDPWAACINLMDAHFPYEPSPEHDLWGGEKLQALHSEFQKPPANEFIQGRHWWQLEAFEHLYDGTIRQLDGFVEQIITGLKRNDVHDDTIIIVTSDHGEGFGEISRLTGRTRLVDHSWGIDEVLTHVPLLVKYPDQTDPAIVDRLASLTEFPSTVEAVLDGTAGTDSFVPEGPVVSSTDRLLEADDGIFDGSSEAREDYYGPWRAVYEQTDEGVKKYAQRGTDSITEVIDGTRVSEHIESGGEKMVELTFADLTPLDLKRSTQGEVTSEVEDRLSELGYLR